MPPSAHLPLVTVVIPTWNRLPLLRQAVASVLAQTWPAWELVVADDGSDDGTAAWIAELGDPRITCLSAAREGHVGRVRNRGAAAGSGPLIAFLDSDDVWLPEKLEAQVAALRDAGAEWSFTGYELMDADGRTVPFRAGSGEARSGWIARDLLAGEIGVDISTLLVTRGLFERVGGFSEDPRLTARGDHELVLRLAVGAPVCGVPRVLTRVGEHPGRLTHALADPHERSARVYELFLQHRPPAGLATLARSAHGEHLRTAARARLARGEYAAAARLFVRAFRAHPAPGPLARAAAGAVRDRLRARSGAMRVAG
ncbi:MAG TPA: glycosyltransferase [Longimicrobium sp.]|nr:glycosyltransferase [Longimicrobium sp.]